MRQKKIIRKRFRGRSSQAFDIDITSLLDILVIMLVFLLKSYNSSGVVFNIPKDITIPKSESQSLNNTGIMVQVSANSIWVDDKSVLDITNAKTSNIFDSGKMRIIPLYNSLVEKRKIVTQVQNSSPDAKPFSGIVNLIVDKSIKYSFLKKVMYTCASAGYKEYKFVVMGEQD
jgi:biopolymer transport protein ExbD